MQIIPPPLIICLFFFDLKREVNAEQISYITSDLFFISSSSRRQHRLSLVCQIKALGGERSREKSLERNPRHMAGFCRLPSPSLPSLLPSAPQQQQDRGSSVFEAVAWMISSEPDLRFPCRRSYDRDGNKITQTRGEYGRPTTRR